MPDKTHGEQLRELWIFLSALMERVDTLVENMKRLRATQVKTKEALSTLSTRAALLEHQVGDLRKTTEESGRRLWALLPPFLAALVGSILTLLGQLLLSYLRK